jgi:hypothetical protein
MATSQALQRTAGTSMPVAGLTPSADSDAPADLVVRNARVFTGDRQRPAASAVAICDGRTLASSDNVHLADAHRFPRGPCTRSGKTGTTGCWC